MREGKRLINLFTELGCHNSGIQDVCRKSQLTLEFFKDSTGLHDFVVKPAPSSSKESAAVTREESGTGTGRAGGFSIVMSGSRSGNGAELRRLTEEGGSQGLLEAWRRRAKQW